jgi:surfeit locus 1 family protein
VVVGFLVFCRLGIWQLQRLEERQAANAHLLQRLDEPPLTLSGQELDSAQADLHRAAVRGTFDFSQEIVLRNQAYGGLPGVHLITPLRITGSDAAVLVDRGWVPIDQADPAQRAAFSRPTTEVEVRGVARQFQTRQSALSPDDPMPQGASDRADQWFRVNIPRIQRQVPYRLMMVFLQEGDPRMSDLAGGPPAGSRLPAPDFQVDLSNGPHLAYAIQWFAFAAILVAGYAGIFYQRTRPAALYSEEEDIAPGLTKADDF